MPLSTRTRSGDLSRQFTDVERQLDDRVTSHLSAPPVNLAIGQSMGQTYKWLEEDLKVRSMIGQQLEQETGMAYAQSARRKLAEQAETQELDDTDALNGMKALREKVAGGKDWNEAHEEVMGENPNLSLNETFSKASADGSKYFESDESRALTRLKQANETLQLNNEAFSMEAMQRFHDENPEVMDETVKQLEQRHKALGITADNSVAAARLAEFQTVQGLRDAEKVREQWKLNPDDTNLDALASIQNSFDDSGLSGVLDIPKTIKRFGSSKAIAGVLTDARWLNTNLPDPKAREELVGAINTANDDSAEPVARQAANNTLLRLGGKYLRDTQRATAWKDSQAQLAEVSKGFQTDYESVSKEITSIATNKEMQKGKAGTPLILSAARGFISQARGVDSASDAVAKEYQGYFDKIPKDLEPAKAAALSRDLMANFAGKLREARLSTAKSAQSVNAAAKEVPVGNPNQAALDWLKANPDDPRASQVKAKLGLK